MRFRHSWLLALLFVGLVVPTVHAQPFTTYDDPVPIGVFPRFTIRADGGGGVGYSRGFTYLEAFVPIIPYQEQFVTFVDIRGVNFFDGRQWEANAGLGTRLRCDFLGDAVIGSNVFYDYRTTGSSRFHQIGAGLEASWHFVDVRANGYFPFGITSNAVSADSFVGNNILLNTETAMTGFDVEAGIPVPIIDDWGARFYGGFYHYHNPDAPTINGGRIRFEAQPNDFLSFHSALQYDGTFGTTVSGGVAFHFGSRRSFGLGRNPTSIMGQRVVRDPNIVVADGKQTALDANGQPLIVQHVNSNAAANGIGTFERPYTTLAQVAAASSPGQTIVVHAGSVFNAQGIVLKDGQRFLADGPFATVVARQGTFAMPIARPGFGAAQINNSPASAITLANNSEASGFTINNSGSHSIFGNGVGNVTVTGNFINNAGNGVPGAADGIRLQDMTGINRITSNTIPNSAGGGIAIFDVVGNPTYTVLVRNNTVTNDALGGIVIAQGNNGTNGSVQIVGNTLLNSAASSILALPNNGIPPAVNTLNLQIYGNTLNANANLINPPGVPPINLENTLNTNTFLNGAVINQVGPISIVPFGSLGFPPP